MRYRIDKLVFTNENGEQRVRYFPKKLTLKGYENISSSINNFEDSFDNAMKVINKHKSVKRSYKFVW